MKWSTCSFHPVNRKPVTKKFYNHHLNICHPNIQIKNNSKHHVIIKRHKLNKFSLCEGSGKPVQIYGKWYIVFFTKRSAEDSVSVGQDRSSQFLGCNKSIIKCGWDAHYCWIEWLSVPLPYWTRTDNFETVNSVKDVKLSFEKLWFIYLYFTDSVL